MADTVLPTRNPTREELIAELCALKPTFMREGVTHMALFGSRAREDNRPDSDVDLVIEVAEGRKFSLVDLAGVGHTVEDSVGLASSILMRRSLAPDLLDALRRDGVELF
jgi:hypothetical protein